MQQGYCTALRWTDGARIHLAWQDGVIQSVQEQDEASDAIRFIAPPLIDLQVNGFAGLDFQDPPDSVEPVRAAVQALGACGCTRFLCALITDAWESLLDKLIRWKRLRDQDPLLRRAIGGWHIEGPFLSPREGFCGAHPPALLRHPTPQQIEALRAAAGDDLLMITLAPELPGAVDSIRRAVELRMRVSLGHTDGTSEQLRRAVEAGASLFTHLGNGTPQSWDRHDNVFLRVLDLFPALPVTLIPDGVHLSPPLFRLIHRSHPRHAIFHISDAMAAAGAPPGTYRLGPLTLEVGADRVVRQPGRSNFAGSALRPLDGVFSAARMLGVGWRETWNHFSSYPARWLGWPPPLQPGSPADFCLLEEMEACLRLTTVAAGELAGTADIPWPQLR